MMGNNLSLFFLSQCENDGYDTYDSMVVCAESEEEAKKIHPNGNWNYDTWATKPENVTCDLIGIAVERTKKGIVCASFKAG